MRIILASFGSYGDINPFLWMSKILSVNGYDVIMITNKYFEQLFNQNNINCIGLGDIDEYKQTLESLNYDTRNIFGAIKSLKTGRQYLHNIFIKPVRETIRKITELKAADTIILSHLLAFGAGLVALKHSLLRVNVALAPLVISGYRKTDGFLSAISQRTADMMNNFVYNLFYGKSLNQVISEFAIEIPKNKKNIGCTVITRSAFSRNGL